MGLYNMMRTSASGMAAQANRLGTVADNIANSSTTGYKRASMEFSSLVLESGNAEFNSGSVEPHLRHAISEQDGFRFTSSSTDLAIKGDGFFVVSDQSRSAREAAQLRWLRHAVQVLLLSRCAGGLRKGVPTVSRHPPAAQSRASGSTARH
jgi:Flagella basal body rod protein